MERRPHMIRLFLVAVGLILLGAVVLFGAIFVVDETEQAIVTRFGDVVAVNRDPGLHMKAPFIDKVVTYDKRILRIASPQMQVLDKDLNVINIDYYARYRIVEPVQFHKTLGSTEAAEGVLLARINGALRAELATRSREEIIGAITVIHPKGTSSLGNEVLTEVVPLESRSSITGKVLDTVRGDLIRAPEQLGVGVIDLRIRRVDFPPSVRESVFERIRSERELIARGIRADGTRRSLEIRAGADKEREILLAEAERVSTTLRGAGEAEAVKILAQAHNQDPEFFDFRRSLEAYRTFLDAQTTAILTTDSDLFRFLLEPDPR